MDCDGFEVIKGALGESVSSDWDGSRPVSPSCVASLVNSSLVGGDCLTIVLLVLNQLTKICNHHEFPL